MVNETQSIGEIVESLIMIKDRYANKLSLNEINSINNACNVLSHSHNRLAQVNTILNEKVATIKWSYDDIMTALADAGYEPCISNVEIVLNVPNLKKDIKTASSETGWKIINEAVTQVSDKLLVLQTEEV